jgi:hypothetical protein
MTTQKEKGHVSDAPPKLQQLPGRSSNKLQGRLYSNAGRGYDRESLQKMSAEGGRTLVASQEEDQHQDKQQEKNTETVEVAASHATPVRENNSSRSIKKYLSGALLFLAGVVIGNVVIPLFTTGTSVVAQSVNNEIASEGSDISTITSITGTEEDAGCSITALSSESKGCSTDAGATTNSSTGITNLSELLPGAK